MKAQILHEGSAVVTVKWWRHQGRWWRLSTCSTEPRAEKMYLTWCCVKKSDWMWVSGVWNSALGIATDFFMSSSFTHISTLLSVQASLHHLYFYPHLYLGAQADLRSVVASILEQCVRPVSELAICEGQSHTLLNYQCFDMTVFFRVLRDKGKTHLQEHGITLSRMRCVLIKVLLWAVTVCQDNLHSQAMLGLVQNRRERRGDNRYGRA